MPRQQHGVLVLDKPEGPTSTKCLESIKRGLGQKKIGHAGTLDPMARGVLLVLLGQGTKLAPYLVEGTKTYRGRIRLGVETDTYDRNGEVLAEHPWEHVHPKDVQDEIESWPNLEEQPVPPFSAAKHKGRPLYALARRGQAVPEKSKAIRIDQSEVLNVQLPVVAFRVRCSQGTYIRSLAHSLGKRFACGAVLTELVREESDPFTLSEAVDLDTVLADAAGLSKRVRGLAEALPHWPKIRLQPDQVKAVRNGKRLRVDDLTESGPSREKDRAVFLSDSGAPVALVEAVNVDGEWLWSILRGFAEQETESD